MPGTQTPPMMVDSPQAYVRLAVCVLLSTIGSVGIWAVVIVLPGVQAEFGIDRAGASLPYTATMIGFALGNVFIGRCIDRMGIIVPAMLTALALGAGFILASYSQQVWQLTVTQGLLIGVGASTGFGPLLAYISHWFKRRRGMAVALTASGNYLAGAIWPVVLKGYLETDGWRVTYFGIGVFCLCTMLPLIFVLRGKTPSQQAVDSGASEQQAVLAISPRHLQWLLMLAGFACCVAMSMPQVHIVAYCVDLGFGVNRGAEMLAIMLAGGVVSRIGFGFLADKIGGLKTCFLASALQALALFVYLPVSSIEALFAVSLLFGLAQGGIVPSYAIIIREFLPAANTGERVGLVMMMTILGMAAGGLATGWIYDLSGTYYLAFIHGIGWNLLNLLVLVLLMWLLLGDKRRGHSPAQPG